MKQAVRVTDDDDDDGGMDAAAYAVIACGCLAFGLLIAAFLWWAHGRGL